MKDLFYKRSHAASLIDDKDINIAFSFCDKYKKFLDCAKTEREAATEIENQLKAKGFKSYKYGDNLVAGDKIFVNNRAKSIIAANIGTDPIDAGVNILVAHIDSPRIDLKQNPLYENSEIALFKTHYYGGIKKYQWATIALSLHGVVIKSDGSKIQINIGEDEHDPVFCISDLLPHLAQEQMKRDASEIIKGEELNVLVGSLPFKNTENAEKIKANILSILHDKFGIVEKDFLSAELELVPQNKAKDIGFDRSMIGAYGQDDRVCAYTVLQALLDTETPQKTTVAVFADKEEIGSMGNTGMQSAFLRYFIADIAETFGSSERIVLSNSNCLSADVNAAFDPTFPDVSEINNVSLLNYGVVITKYNGSKGKSGSSDANAEYISQINTMLDKNNIVWQTGELGRVDMGGGGTVAAYIANMGPQVVDIGVPVISMHSPFEITAKLDVYMAYKAFCAFCKNS
ncbi:MAG: aminopeptidase [Bacteroidia bacterium]|nr:aminopeptidase [Bacteroidia bacterium]